MIVKIFSVNPSYLLVNHASEYIEEKNGNKYFTFDDSINENKALLKNMFGIELKTKSKQYMVVRRIIMEKITRKLNLILTMTCH